MLKRLLIIFLAIFAIASSSIIFHLPYRLVPIFLRFRYGISAQIEKITGGFKSGLTLSNVRLSRGSTSIECEEIITDIRLLGFRENLNKIYINSPRISVGDIGSGENGFLGIPFWIDTDILIRDAEVSFGGGLPVRFNGGIRIFDNNISIDKIQFILGELGLNLVGSIDKNRNLSLYANFADSENKFSITGSLDKPYINTHWSGLDTSFQVEDIGYEDGQLVISKIAGDVNIEGFPPIDLNGGLCIEKDHIGFRDLIILNVAHINGAVNKDKPSRIRLSMDNVDGAKMVGRLPDVLRVLILSHNIDADVSIYGMMDNIQAGGIIRLLSTPTEIVCRYRNNRFSFHSRHGGSTTIGDGLFGVSGSINWYDMPTIKIKGKFYQMDIKDLGIKGKGIVDGEFSITGELENPVIESRLEITDAEIGSMKFDAAYLNLQGTGSGQLNLVHSMVYYKEIPAELTGFINLREEDILKNIEIKPVGDAIIWEGVNILRDAEVGSVTIQKDVDKNISIRLKSASSSDSGESEDKRPEVELEYKLREDKNLLLRMQEDEGTVGVEHKVKF